MNPENVTVISYDPSRRMTKVAGPRYAPVWVESEALAHIVAVALAPNAKIVVKALA